MEEGEGDDGGWDGWMASPTWWTWVWVGSGSWWCNREAWHAAVHAVTKSWTWLSDWTEMNKYFSKEDIINTANKHAKWPLTSLLQKCKSKLQLSPQPIRIVIIKKSTNNKCLRGCGEKRRLQHCWWEHKLVQPQWKTEWMFHKKLKINLPCVYPCSLTQLHPTLCDCKDCSLPDSSAHGIYSPIILKWVAISSFRDSFQRRDQTCISCIGRKTLFHWATWESLELPYSPAILLLDIYLEKTRIQKVACTQMFTATLFTISRTWKQQMSISRGMDKEDVI